MQTRVDAATILRAAAACAVQAPSTHNTQPWRLRLRGDALELSVDDRRRLGVIDPLGRQMVISCGCALYNARVAIRAHGFVDDTTLFPDPSRPELLAITRLGLVRQAGEDERALLAAIPRRHTNRRPFLDRPVSETCADALALAARAERTRFHRLTPAQKLRFGELVAAADLRQYADPRFREELERWLTPSISWRLDGIPFARKEYGTHNPFAVRRRLRAKDLGRRFAALERDRIQAAPVIAVLSTGADEPIDWLDCGQALEAVLLRATTLGLATSYLNQVLEVQALAEAVDELVAPGRNAQMILRIGWAEATDAPAPRRPLEEVLEVE